MKKLFFLAVIVCLLVIGVTQVHAQDNQQEQQQNDDSGFIQLINPLGFLKVDGKSLTEPGQLVKRAFQAFASLIALVAIAFVVFSGFKLILATSEESIKTAKESLTWAVGGFVVSMLAFTLVSGAANLLGFQNVPPGADQVINPTDGAVPGGGFLQVLFYIMQGILGLLGFATTLMIIYYGYRYMTSAGNEETIDAAKRGLKYAVAGFAIAILSYTIINIVRNALLFRASL